MGSGDNYFIYLINFSNDKSYIGVSLDPLKRIMDHLRYCKRIKDPKLEAGELEGISFKILQKVPEGVDPYILEAEFIKKFNTLEPAGYNQLATNKGSDPSREGTKNPRSKLSKDDVIDIRTYYHNGIKTQLELSIIYGVSRATIYNVVKGLTYKNVGGPLSREDQSYRGGNAQFYTNNRRGE